MQSPVLPLAEIALFLDLPYSTIETLHRAGDGPRTFKIGRRLYVTQQHFREWLDAMANANAPQ